MATTNGFDTVNPPRKTSSDSSGKTLWARAVPALILALCLTAFPSAPTWANAEVPDGVFNDTITGTITGMAVADARRAENPGGGGWFRINELHVK